MIRTYRQFRELVKTHGEGRIGQKYIYLNENTGDVTFYSEMGNSVVLVKPNNDYEITSARPSSDVLETLKNYTPFRTWLCEDNTACVILTSDTESVQQPLFVGLTSTIGGELVKNAAWWSYMSKQYAKPILPMPGTAKGQTRLAAIINGTDDEPIGRAASTTDIYLEELTRREYVRTVEALFSRVCEERIRMPMPRQNISWPNTSETNEALQQPAFLDDTPF